MSEQHETTALRWRWFAYGAIAASIVHLVVSTSPTEAVNHLHAWWSVIHG